MITEVLAEKPGPSCPKCGKTMDLDHVVGDVARWSCQCATLSEMSRPCREPCYCRCHDMAPLEPERRIRDLKFALAELEEAGFLECITSPPCGNCICCRARAVSEDTR